MTGNNPRKISRRQAQFTVLLLATGLFAAGAANTTSAQETQEVIVKAPLSLSKLRSEIGKAEDAMYDLYNSYNDDDRFDIKCKYVKRWQSVIRERVCAPTFMASAREEEVNAFIGALPESAPTQKGGPGVTSIDHNYALLREKMDAIYRQQPEFRRAMDTLNDLKREYEDRRQDKLGK